MTKKKKRINILLSGCGLGGKVHADLLSRSERSKLAAIVAPSSTRNLSFASRWNVPIFDSIDEALDHVHIDGAIIASPNHIHAAQSISCIERKIPVLVEKPLATSLQEALEICKKADTKGVSVLVGHHRCYNPMLITARDFINSEKFGSMVAMQGAALFYKPDHYFNEGHWRTKHGGGPIAINLIHEIGVMRFLCGEIKSVTAIDSKSQRGFEVEDTAGILFRFDGNAIGTFILSDVAASNHSWEHTTGENKAFPKSLNTSCYHFAGTNGSLDFPSMKAVFYKPDTQKSWWNTFQYMTLQTDSIDPLEKQLIHFEDVIINGDKPMVPAKFGYENMKVVEAIRKSILIGKTVEVTDG